MKTAQAIGMVTLLLAVSMPVVAVAEEMPNNLTKEQVMSEGENLIKAINEVRREAEATLRKLNEQGDAAGMTAVGEAYTALKGLEKLAEDWLFELKSFANQGNLKQAWEILQKIKITKKKVDDLDSQVKSSRRVGDALLEEGQPTLEKLVDADLPTSEQDPLESTKSDQIVLQVPVATSPYE